MNSATLPAQHPLIARLEAAAEVKRTRCGDGHMVWHVWGKGPNLVLLHGNLGSWQHWIRNIEFLSGHFRVIATDIPGFGDSDMPPSPYSAQSLGRIVADGIAELTGKTEPVNFAGFSFGSGVSAEAAHILGSRVDRLVLVSAGTKMEGVSRFDIPPFVRWRGLPQDQRDAAHRRNIEIMMLAEPASIDDLALRIQSENAAKARLNIDLINQGASHTKVTPHLKCKLAAIWGERDSVIGPNMQQRTGWLQKHHPGARHIIIRGAGHWCIYEDAQATNQALLDLLLPEKAPPSGQAAAA